MTLFSRRHLGKKKRKIILISSGIAVLLLVAVLIISQQSEFIRKAIYQPDSEQSEEKDVQKYLDTEPTLEFVQFVEEEKQEVLDDIDELQRS